MLSKFDKGYYDMLSVFGDIIFLACETFRHKKYIRNRFFCRGISSRSRWSCIRCIRVEIIGIV